MICYRDDSSLPLSHSSLTPFVFCPFQLCATSIPQRLPPLCFLLAGRVGACFVALAQGAAIHLQRRRGGKGNMLSKDKDKDKEEMIVLYVTWQPLPTCSFSRVFKV